MKKLSLLKATRDTRLFKKGQKLWVLWGTGALAAFVVCRYKNKGRWIKCWARWPDSDGESNNHSPNARWIGEVEVTDEFAEHVERVGGH